MCIRDRVMEAFLKSPQGRQVTALFAHNDDMALGAIQAIEETGKKPGQDIVVVSIDAIRSAFVAMTEGKLNCTVECNPLLGPPIFDAIEAIKAGKTIPKKISLQERLFEQTEAKELLKSRQY